MVENLGKTAVTLGYDASVALDREEMNWSFFLNPLRFLEDFGLFLSLAMVASSIAFTIDLMEERKKK